MAWPAVVLFIFVALKGNIRKFIDRMRVKRVEGMGFAAEMQSPESDDVRSAPFQPQWMGYLDPQHKPFLDQMMQAVAKEADTLMEKTGKSRENILFQSAVANWATAIHERTYRDILRSQLELLDYLSTAFRSPPSKMSEFYANATAEYPEAFENYSFGDWVGWMTHMGLISRDEDQWRLTDRGMSFMAYMRREKPNFIAIKTF
jgi:hypothetical protein